MFIAILRLRRKPFEKIQTSILEAASPNHLFANLADSQSAVTDFAKRNLDYSAIKAVIINTECPTLITHGDWVAVPHFEWRNG